jgi:hypothetical protein
MVSFGSRKSEAGSLSIYLMVGAFLVAGGFFAWLSVRATPVEVAVEEEAPVENLATVVGTDVFGTNPMAQAGMVIQLHRLGVETLIGTEAFFVGASGLSSGYLVKMISEVVASGGVLETGATVSLTGMVHVRTDSVVDAWVASGGIGEGDRILAEFSESFFEASEVEVTAPPQPQ